MPKKLIHSSPLRNRYFTREYELKKFQVGEKHNFTIFLMSNYKFKRPTAERLSRILQKFLKFAPEERISIDELLNDPWTNSPSEQIERMDVSQWTDFVYREK